MDPERKLWEIWTDETRETTVALHGRAFAASFIEACRALAAADRTFQINYREYGDEPTWWHLRCVPENPSPNRPLSVSKREAIVAGIVAHGVDRRCAEGIADQVVAPALTFAISSFAELVALGVNRTIVWHGNPATLNDSKLRGLGEEVKAQVRTLAQDSVRLVWS